MKRLVLISLVIALVIALVGGIILTNCAPPEWPTPTFEEVAWSFLDQVTLPPSSIVYLSGPVKPGTVIRENAALNVTAVELKIPEAPGTYYAFIIDDMPDYEFAHPMRYVWMEWMEYGTGNIEVVNASWWAQILQPGVPPAPFEITNSQVIDGKLFAGIKGSGAGKTHDISDKPLALPTTIPEHACGGRYALVIDGGDRSVPRVIAVGGGPSAKENAEDADNIAGWLTNSGYQVQRISQYWGNNHPRLLGGAGNTELHLAVILMSYAKNLTCCDNFFLYISGHGVKDKDGKYSFSVYNASGKGDRVRIPVDDLFLSLKGFPDCCKVTIFIDTCQAGAAIPALAPLRASLSKVTILTSADADHGAPSGTGDKPSPTENFMKGAGKDNDGDKKKGDLGDRVNEMQKQGEGYNPQKSQDPRYDNLCDLD